MESRLAEYFATCPYPVTLAYLFGSQAKGETTLLSDVDIAVYLAETDPLIREQFYLPFLLDLRRFLGAEDVDLIYLNDVSPLLGHRIIKNGRLLYASHESQRVKTEVGLLQRYLDHQEFYDVQNRYLRQRVLQHRMGEGGREMIDREVIDERLRYIDEMLRFLKGYASLSLEEFKDREKSHAALYELHTCLEAITDIANHLVAALNLRKPEDRGELMTILAEAGIIPHDLAASLAKAIGLRHLIVHAYLRIALNLIHRSLQEDLGDIEEFCRCIMQYLEMEG